MKHKHKRIAITGTPGTGKSSVAKKLKELGFNVQSVRELAEKYNCAIPAEIAETEGEGEEEGGEKEVIVDIEKLKSKIEKENEEEIIIEGHLSHHFSDIAIVLRCNPLILKDRLEKRGWKKEKVLENVEAELVDVILIEALDNCEEVYEIDTTNKSVEEVTSDVLLILNALGFNSDLKSGKSELDKLSEFKPGKVDWISVVGDRIDELMR